MGKGGWQHLPPRGPEEAPSRGVGGVGVPCAPSGEEFCSVPRASLQISWLLGLGSAVLLLLGVLRAPSLSWQCAGPLAACMSMRGGWGRSHGLPSLSVRACCSGPCWYWDSHTQPPCSLQLPRGLVAPRLGVPQRAAAALMVCTAGQSVRRASRPRGKWYSQGARPDPPAPDPCSACSPPTNKPERDARIRRRPGPPRHMLGSGGRGAAFPRQPQSPAQLCGLSAAGNQGLGTARAAQIGPPFNHSYFPRTEDNGPSATSHQRHLWCRTASVTLLTVSSPGPAHASAVSAHPGVPGVAGCGVEGGAVWVSVLRNKQKID
ncbi:uncharacterized protein LOC115944655 [Leptonychotes weddellii]|uniref:Uncharacterized protein LOC115944655 n=1 Tax=Leptonychotes weddellii TaxID=9713 RepID=A0A7F8RS79_LEPWE|nr:uncharacterized protein LOC115944655 [Leptonychotes weddellii]